MCVRGACVSIAANAMLDPLVSKRPWVWAGAPRGAGAMLVFEGSVKCACDSGRCPCDGVHVRGSGIHAQVHYWLNLQRGKEQLCPSAGAESPGPQAQGGSQALVL